jgi:hypothetical protein
LLLLLPLLLLQLLLLLLQRLFHSLKGIGSPCCFRLSSRLSSCPCAYGHLALPCCCFAGRRGADAGIVGVSERAMVAAIVLIRVTIIAPTSIGSDGFLCWRWDSS